MIALIKRLAVQVVAFIVLLMLLALDLAGFIEGGEERWEYERRDYEWGLR